MDGMPLLRGDHGVVPVRQDHAALDDRMPVPVADIVHHALRGLHFRAPGLVPQQVCLKGRCAASTAATRHSCLKSVIDICFPAGIYLATKKRPMAHLFTLLLFHRLKSLLVASFQNTFTDTVDASPAAGLEALPQLPDKHSKSALKRLRRAGESCSRTIRLPGISTGVAAAGMALGSWKQRDMSRMFSEREYCEDIR
jgi:hypothetical protein